MGEKVSFILPALDEGENLYNTIKSLQDTNTCDYEIIVVDNGSTDGSTDFIEKGNCNACIRLFKIAKPLGVARARNFGAAFAEGDIIVFVDAHIIFLDGWITPIIELLQREDVGIVAPAVSAWGAPGDLGFGMHWTDATLNVEWLGKRAAEPYAVPMLPGLCQAFRWDFFHKIEGFDYGIVGYGIEDLEICVRTWLLGYKVFIVPEVQISHLFRANAPYKIHWMDAVYNMLRAIYTLFHAQRAERVVAEIRSLPYFREAYELVRDSDVWSRRRSLEVRRIYDDNWFFDKFSMNF
jgi:glycosyltransferase involved in cell wall biosynthesis